MKDLGVADDLDLAAVSAVQKIPSVTPILDVVCRTTGMGFAAVARVTDDRWIACAVKDDIAFGLAPGGELKVETTLCHDVRGQRQAIVFEDAQADPVYCDHPTPALYGLRSYISVPITLADGSFFGTLCAIDPKPARVNTPEIIEMFRLFAELIGHHLDAVSRVAAAELRLKEEVELAALREQFIAVLGHDLRNPIASVRSGTNMLLKYGWTDRSPYILELIQSSTVRMADLVDNLVDLARTRLGGGIPLNIDSERSLQQALEVVLRELSIAHPQRDIRWSIAVEPGHHVDHARIGQLVSNLLANAIVHGDPAEPVHLSAQSEPEELVISVRNAGMAIPEKVQASLFQPFGNSHGGGLGLGLYIASEIARRHGGRVEVSSDDTETSFSFHLPRTATPMLQLTH
jgi:signal transduction histidine kinase